MNKVIANDAIIINQTKFCSPQEAEKVRQMIIQQIHDDGIAMCPVGFTAVVADRELIYADMRGES